MKCKNKIMGISIICLGIGILLASFFSPWIVIGLLSSIIIICGAAMIINS